MPADRSQFVHTTIVVIAALLYLRIGNMMAKNLSTEMAVNVSTLDVTASTENIACQLENIYLYLWFLQCNECSR